MNKLQVVAGLVNEILDDKGEAAMDNITEKTSLRKDAGFDSMDLAVLTARLDSEYGVDIFADGIVDTVGEVLEKLG